MAELDRSEDFLLFTRNNIERKLRKSQINLQRLSTIFEVEPSSLHVVEEFGDTAEFPNSEGKFNVQTFRSGSMLRVEGRPLSSTRSTLANTFPSTTQPYASTSFTPMFRSVIPSSSTKVKKNTATIKVTKAENSGGKIVHATRQTYVVIDDSIATVDYIESFCRQEFSEQNLVLVTSNGLKIEDCEATRGLNFWKNSSRKIYAVPGMFRGKGKNPKRKKSDPYPASYIDLSDDDDDSYDDFEAPQTTSAIDIKELANSLKPVISESTSKAIQDAFLLRPCEREVFKEIVERFTCLICRDIAKVDVIVSSCCGTVTGCRACLDTWFETNETCPKCRDIRGREKCIILRGFGDVLDKASAILGNHETY